MLYSLATGHLYWCFLICELDKWEEVAPYLSDALTDASGECADCGIKIEEDADVEEVIESILHTFYKNIADGRYREAVAVYKMAERRWPMHFSAGESNEDNEASQTPGGHEGVKYVICKT